MARSDRAEALLALAPEARRRELKALSHRQRRAMRTHWRLWAHDGQVPPKGRWHTWLIVAGRGYGKTRAGAEWVRAAAEADAAARIALVGASLGEARRVMVEGPSGVLAVAPPRRRPTYEPSKRQLTWPNGAVATLYSAGEPESLRGPQHSHASRERPTIHRRRRRKAKAGWWPPRRPAYGKDKRALWPASRPATGYSLRRATGWRCSTDRRARGSTFAARGSGRPHRLNPPEERLSILRPGQRSSS